VEPLAETIAAAFGLSLGLPVFLLIALLIRIEDGGPVFFRQTRVGRNGRSFQLLKFRSMRVHSPGTSITAATDRRITRVGRVLRHYKLDELPQLWNVLTRDMSLIGPRPEVPEYVDLRDTTWRDVLGFRPGITDLASLIYRDEEQVLARRGHDLDRYYREVILPEKLSLNLRYCAKRSLWLDLKLIGLTIRYSFIPKGFDRDRVRQQFPLL
jgi:lipopolysaccharide/colanic/teichoic acid biosynthesis glycosyltransferase